MQDLEYSRYYSIYHNDSQSHQRWQIEFNRRILGMHLSELRGTPALDIGCGMGFTMLFLQQEGYHPVQGIDIDAGQVAASLRKGLDVVQVDDASAFIDQQGQRYGMIVAMDVLEHMTPNEQLVVLRSAYRALLPGGRFICSVPNANSTIAARQRYNDFTHHTSFTEHSLDFLLFNGGFRQIEIDSYEFFLPAHKKNIGPADFARPRHFLSYLIRDYLRWSLFGLVRGWRRIEMMGELGFETGRAIPLSLNLLGIATKQ